MGLDEALLERAETPLTLRLYTWSPDTLSLGYFQRFEEVPATRHVPAVVRRITGGGAIHHAGELTFSITAPASHALYRGPVALSYERVHGAVIEALASFGVDASLRHELSPTSDRDGTGMCFHHSTSLDIVWSGAKGVGSAQRRRGGRVLHHGSIKLAASDLESGVARAPEVGPVEMGAALVHSLATRFDLTFEDAEPTASELEAAEGRGARFTSEEWLKRR